MEMKMKMRMRIKLEGIRKMYYIFITLPNVI